MKRTFTKGLMGSGKSKKLIYSYLNSTGSASFAAHLSEKTGTEGTISSRNGQRISTIYLNSNDPAAYVINELERIILEKDISTVYVDEVQFFSQDVLSAIIESQKRLGYVLHLFGLDLTFTGEYFDGSQYLLQSAEIPSSNIFHLEMSCENDFCDDLAKYNARIVEGKVVRDGETFLESKQSYKALCQSCYFS